MSAPIHDEMVRVPAEIDEGLQATLAMPEGATRLVVMADGNERSLENRPFRSIAKALNEAGIGTLLLELLTSDEAKNADAAAQLRENVALMASRFGAGADWLEQRFREDRPPLGYCASGPASAAALSSSLAHTDVVRAVVSLEGLPDLSGRELENVSAATLLVAAGSHLAVLDSNRAAFLRMSCEKKLVVVSGVTWLLDEHGALSAATGATRRWFERHLTRATAGDVRARVHVRTATMTTPTTEAANILPPA